ncbi:MAG: hypothetical protein ACLT9P_08630 [Evtepia gabavorous]
MADKGIHVFYFVQLGENGLFLAGVQASKKRAASRFLRRQD